MPSFLETTFQILMYSIYSNSNILEATEKCIALSEAFKDLAERGDRTKASRPPYEPERRKINIDLLDSECKCIQVCASRCYKFGN